MLTETNAPISRSMQRWFGLSLSVLVAIIATSLRAIHGNIFPVGLGLAVVIAAVYYGLAASQLPIIRIWQKLTYPVGFVVGHLLFGSIFVFIVVPMGCLMRLLRYDPLRLRDETRMTNWQEKSQTKRPVESYFRQY